MPSKTTTIRAATTAPATDLDIAQQELAAIRFQASRVAVSLRSIGRTISDEDNPIDPKNIGGLCEAMELIGECLEHFVADRQILLDHIEQERQSSGG